MTSTRWAMLVMATAAAPIAGNAGSRISPASATLASCALPGTGPRHEMALARDIADSGKRSMPAGAKALVKRAADHQLASIAAANQVFATDSANGTISVSSATSDPAAAGAPPGGRGASMVTDDESGCVLLSMPERGEIVAIDPDSATITRTYTLAGEQRPGALLLDAADRLLIVANAGVPTLEVVNLKTMEVMDVTSADAPVRALALDSAWHRVFVVTQDGRVSGYDLRRSRLMDAGTLGAISATDIAVDSRTHAVYLLIGGRDQRTNPRVLAGVAPAAPRCPFHHSTPGSPCWARYAPTR